MTDRQLRPDRDDAFGRRRTCCYRGGCLNERGRGAAVKDLPAAVAGLRVGDQVRHDSYGVGTVVGLEGKGRSLTARVEFVIDGAPTTKRLILRYAPVAKI